MALYLEEGMAINSLIIPSVWKIFITLFHYLRKRYDNSNDCYIGDENTDKALVFITRGVSSKWKFLVSFKFTSSATRNGLQKKKDLFELTEKLESAGILVYFISSDMGQENIQFLNDLGVTVSQKTLIHSLDPKRKIYIFADV